MGEEKEILEKKLREITDKMRIALVCNDMEAYHHLNVKYQELDEKRRQYEKNED